MIIFGAGHRPDKLCRKTFADNPGGPNVYRVIVDLLKPTLSGLATHVISGMAQGWDLGLAETARQLGIPWTAAIPFRGHEERWPERLRWAYASTLASAAYVIEVCEPGYADWKYNARNAWGVDRCDLVLACWDGSESGSANCIRYADGKKPVVNAWGEFCDAVDGTLPF